MISYFYFRNATMYLLLYFRIIFNVTKNQNTLSQLNYKESPYKASLWKSIIKQYWKPILSAVVYRIFQDVIQFLKPVLLSSVFTSFVFMWTLFRNGFKIPCNFILLKFHVILFDHCFLLIKKEYCRLSLCI